MRIIAPTILILLLIHLNTVGQKQPDHEAKIFVDSIGQVFTRVDAPAYLFMGSADSNQEPFLIPSTDKHANPMEWDGHGFHYITYKNPKTGENINFKVFADGIPPVSSLHFTEGLLFNYNNTFFAEKNATISIRATDEMSGVEQSYISTQKNDLVPYSNPISLTNEGELLIKAYSVDNVGNAEPIKEFKVIIADSASIQLNNIYFELNSTKLSSIATNELSKLASLLHNHTNIQLEIRAHTDSRGGASFNQRLSEERAQAVVNFLKYKGIANSRLTAKGFGESQLLNECADGVECSDAMHKVNRRVELIVSKIEQ